MIAYADTSFVVCLYVTEVHSPTARLRVSDRPRIWLTTLHRVEWAHAMAQHLFRGTLSRHEAAQFQSAFESDRKSGKWVQTGIPEPAYETAVLLAEEFGQRIGMKTLDTLHVASALELGARTFWTFDEREAKLAKAAGLTLT